MLEKGAKGNKKASYSMFEIKRKVGTKMVDEYKTKIESEEELRGLWRRYFETLTQVKR